MWREWTRGPLRPAEAKACPPVAASAVCGLPEPSGWCTWALWRCPECWRNRVIAGRGMRNACTAQRARWGGGPLSGRGRDPVLHGERGRGPEPPRRANSTTQSRMPMPCQTSRKPATNQNQRTAQAHADRRAALRAWSEACQGLPVRSATALGGCARFSLGAAATCGDAPVNMCCCGNPAAQACLGRCCSVSHSGAEVLPVHRQHFLFWTRSARCSLGDTLRLYQNSISGRQGRSADSVDSKNGNLRKYR